jgi:hypothetical protein
LTQNICVLALTTLSYAFNSKKKKGGRKRKNNSEKNSTEQANDNFDLFADMPMTTNAMASNMSVLGEITQTTNTTFVENNNKRRRVDNAINNIINVNSKATKSKVNNKASKANRRSVR